ncbi:uncharacterized protein TEOVI_000758000 [Trypanosoma equiperdum]|uniref:Trypanosomal VSG domain containing protein n=1 Tax=Trypanosoma equiperdum TaxID=5694 RepID=A0A1G4I5X8_TRYEQ|nr:hypothetical protein TEOVI_000758000 [Trypanosoma equiperdum]
METTALMLLTLLTVIAAQTANQAAADTVIGDDGNQWCHELAYLRATSMAARQHLVTNVERLKENEQVLLYWRIAEANSRDLSEEIKYKALLLVWRQVQKRGVDEAAAMEPVLNDLDSALQNRIEALAAGEIARSALKLAGTTATPSTKAGVACTVAAALQPETNLECQQASPPLRADSATLLMKRKGAKAINLAPTLSQLSIFAPPTITLTVAGKSNAFNGTQNTPSTCKTGTGGSPIVPNTDNIAITVT